MHGLSREALSELQGGAALELQILATVWRKFPLSHRFGSTISVGPPPRGGGD